MPDYVAFVSLKQVAERAGVSPSTASRALSGRGYAKAEVRARVEGAAQELGYEPHLAARSLRLRAAQMIGLVIQDITNPFYAFIAKGIEDVLRAADYRLVLFDSEEDQRREGDNLRILAQTRPDGVIITPTYGSGTAMHLLQQRGMPIVQVDRVVPGVRSDAILINNFSGAYLATEHLIMLKHRAIGAICGPQTLTTGRERYRGFVTALRDHGIPFQRELAPVGDFRRDNGYELACKLLDGTPRPSAIIAMNNVVTEGVLQALTERNLGIPGQVAIIGFDDMPWARFVSPPLTVVSQPAYTMGAMAAETLIRRLKGTTVETDPSTIVLEPTLIVRGSCGGQPGTR
jgi:DNA-binding LacI/PurR family transcriptional regulator